ncbi:HAMP domain-containing sensor histidine kinase [Hyphomicrobium sp. B1]|uniref:sensor histidine kinase n=1 Tax=Hyphomicrobium sp. B1 TaxID=3075651 RepID=UPI003C2D1F17
MSVGSLRLRLLAAGVLSILLALGIAAFGLTELFKRHVERRVDAELTIYLNQLAAGLTRKPSGELALAHRPSDPRFEEPLSGLYWQIEGGSPTDDLRSRSLWDTVLSLPPETNVADVSRRYEIVGPQNARLYLLQRYIELPDNIGGSKVRIAVAVDSREVGQSVRSFASELAPFLLIIGALLVAASWVQVSVGLRPLSTIRGRLSSIRSGKQQRLGGAFPKEVRPLAEEIDALLDEREKAIEKARGRAADLAHGLKTPLQVLNGEVTRLEEKGETRIASDISYLVNLMRRHIDREIARARISYANSNASTNVRTSAEQIIRVVEKTPRGQSLSWTIDAPPDLEARIDAVDLAESLGNLLDNAARHAKEKVSVKARAEMQSISISIIDDGPGIEKEHQAAMLIRGQRLDTHVGGAGLGLAIVTDIVEAWGGSLTIENGTVGLIATLRLPAATNDSDA